MRLLAIRCSEELLLQLFTEGKITNGFQVHKGLPPDCKLLATRMVGDAGIIEFLFIEQEHLEDDVLPWLLPVELIEIDGYWGELGEEDSS